MDDHGYSRMAGRYPGVLGGHDKMRCCHPIQRCRVLQADDSAWRDPERACVRAPQVQLHAIATIPVKHLDLADNRWLRPCRCCCFRDEEFILRMLEPRVPVVDIEHGDKDASGGVLAPIRGRDTEGVAVTLLIVQLTAEDDLSSLQHRELFT